ncbi:MAG: histidine kinase [Bacteroidota bacterium]
MGQILRIVLVLLLFQTAVYGQPVPTLRGDSWAQVQRQRGGVITVVYDVFPPFAFPDSSGRLVGIEIELLESFRRFVNQQYGYALQIEWINGGGFEKTYERVRLSTNPGVFGVASFSLTPERQRQVRFTVPYMPDLNVLVTHAQAPDYKSGQDFIRDLPQMKAYTIPNTTMAQDLDSIRRAFHPTLPVEMVADDYKVADQIARDKQAFGYLPLSLFLYAHPKGLKRQQVLPSERTGFAAIYPLNSDWNAPMEAYANAPNAAQITDQIVRKYLSGENANMVFSTLKRPSGYQLALISLQKELVMQRLINTTVELKAQKIYHSLAILGVAITLILAVVQYLRFVGKQRLNRLLTQQNETIWQQKKEIELFNRKLEMKVLQGQMNPHFIFNSLNAIQYFVSLDQKRQSLAYIAAFSRFMRYLLQNASTPYTPIRQEASMLEQYLALEKMRFSDKFSYQVIIAESETLPDARLPSLLVHPFVENALYHSILNRPDNKGLITIRFEASSNHLTVTIDDNGIGQPSASGLAQIKKSADLTPHEQLAQERIALLNEGKEDKITLETTGLLNPDESAAGTRLVIHFPQVAMEV